MATVDEMVNMVNMMDDKDRGRIAETVWGNPGRYSSLAMGLMYHALRDAERRGRCQCGGNRINDEPRTYWIVGDYIVTYLTDDLNFSARMLTEEMMNDLIIEEY